MGLEVEQPGFERAPMWDADTTAAPTVEMIVQMNNVSSRTNA